MTTGTIVMLSGKKFGICFAPAVILSTLSMYISQMIFKSFLPGMVLNLLFALLFPILLLREKNRKFLKECYFSYGFILFLAIAFSLVVIDRGYVFSTWDELSHWGMMVKEMFRTGRFYTEDVSHLYVHKEYPPFSALWELFLCKLTLGFSEEVCAFGLHLFNFMMLFSVVVEYMNKSVDKLQSTKAKIYRVLAIALFSFVVLFWVIAMDRDDMLMTIYTDLVVAMILVYCLAMIIFDEAYSGISGVLFLGLSLSALILTKQIGIVLSLIVMFYYFARMIFIKAIAINKKMVLVSLLCVVLAPVFFWLSWRHYTSGIVSGGQFDLGQINIAEVFAVLNGGGSEQSRLIRDTYLNRLFKKSVIAGNIKLPYFWLLPALWVGLAIISCFSKEGERFKESVILGITYACGCVGYGFTLFVLYLFCFPNEAPAVCYRRYISSLVIPFVVLFFYFGIKMLDKKTIDRTYLVSIISLIVVSCLVLKWSCLLKLKPAILKGDPCASFRNDAERIVDTTERGSKIFIVANSNANYQYFIGYYANEHIMDFRAAANLLEMDYSKEEVKNSVTVAMGENDYIYIKEYSDLFNDEFSYLIDGESFKSESVYKVIHTDGDSYKLVLASDDVLESLQ